MHTLIVPCAGRSSRFPNMRPKYLLTHPDGEIMLNHALKCLDLSLYDRIIITIVQEHIEKFDAKTWLLQSITDIPFEICELPEFTSCSCETVARTIEMMNVEGAITIKDCDNSVSINIQPNVCNFVVGYSLEKHSNVSNISQKSFLIFNENNLLVDIIEKRIVSDTICLGIYSFCDSTQFIKCYNELLKKGVESELYVSHIISYMISKYNTPFEVFFADDFCDYGTISEWKNIYEKMKTFFVDFDGVLIKNSGKYGKINWSNNNQFIEENILTLKKLQDNGADIIITTSRDDSFRDFIQESLNSFGLKPKCIITGLNHSKRILINDFANTNTYPSAEAISIPRNALLDLYLH